LLSFLSLQLVSFKSVNLRSQCRFLLTGHQKTDTIDQLMNQLKWLHLEKRNELMIEDNKLNESRDAYIPGGGIAQKFHKNW
jgi:hypothetical protein